MLKQYLIKSFAHRVFLLLVLTLLGTKLMHAQNIEEVLAFRKRNLSKSVVEFRQGRHSLVVIPTKHAKDLPINLRGQSIFPSMS